MLYAFRYAPDFGIDGDRLVDVVFIGVVMGVICARAYYVIFAPFDYTSFWQMIDIRQGGLAIYGGVIGAFVFGGLAAKWRKVPILPLFDLVGICFLIGQGVGRWANFINQEAFGTNTTLPWGMYRRRHPGIPGPVCSRCLPPRASPWTPPSRCTPPSCTKACGALRALRCWPC